ncbi:uncharacterized protein BX664DRAFT_291996 [Halteromyces radiatus]|uniref:uncharacterized protein n=1 Tax=Halteromyces radiatus TaxID=101107 RepID=UPI002220A8FF|nr:uncharacterized protein BX664DRAFT_291996 [Halteromyces radiatus]KAI8096829.1 hypothetical protein BX664DRAFT_291996 [Halteromyces radiatus]
MPSSLDSPSSDKTNLIMNNNSSPLETTLENPDQVMDMFLHQVTEYNAQQLSFDDRMANANDFSSSHFFSSNVDHNGIKVESTSQDLSHFSMPTSFLGGLEDQSISTQAQVSSSSSAVSIQQEQQKTTEDNNTTKRHSKQKSKEGSSLLHVFTNPLLHAIPMLARNCLNFEDFLTQAAIQGQNGLLGSKDGNKTNNGYTTPDSLILDPTSDKSLMMTKPECPWHVKVLGLPLTGAKSRVETQIKICLQLTNSAGELATNWSHLILPEHMVARDKLKRRNQKYTNTGELHASDEKSTLADSDLLKLEAAVVCDSHADNEIIMCSSCVHRERKRMKRKRDNKVARAANKEGGAAKLAALFANDLPDLTNENVMAEERKKILLFNCSEYVEFNNGEATLPTRVTCYCRHHSEKVGFRIVFTIKDCHNHVLGTGRSPPIMITDDHKSSKAQSATPAPQSVPATSQPTTSRKRKNSIGNNVYTKILQQRKTTENSNKNSVPRLHRLIPSEGPIYGGSEVTVLGSNFYEGLTCLFGENPAIPTHCWSANTLLCILPPAVSAGPVVVSFKEHPLMLEGQDVVLFTYFDESDRALMELALQVVGLKTMGKVEDARQIAMRIVQGDSNNQDRKNNNSRNTATSSTPTTKSLVNTRNGSHRQLWIKDCISITNRNRHTLLHLAAIRGYARLVHILVHLDCPVDQMDRNGFTALHFASWTGKVAIVKALLDKADSRIETVSGKTALQLATDAGHENVVALFNNMKNNNNNNNNNSQVSSSLLSVPSRRRSSSISSISSMSSSSGSFTSVAVRVPLIDIIPSSAAVSSAKSILPDKLFNMLSSLYTISSNTSCIQQLSQSVTTVYTSMLDPF